MDTTGFLPEVSLTAHIVLCSPIDGRLDRDVGCQRQFVRTHPSQSVVTTDECQVVPLAINFVILTFLLRKDRISTSVVCSGITTDPATPRQ